MENKIETYTSRLSNLKNFYHSYVKYGDEIGFQNFEKEIRCEELLDMIPVLISLSKNIGRTLNKADEVLKFETQQMHLPLDYDRYIEFFLTDGFIERNINNEKVRLYGNLKERFLKSYKYLNLFDDFGEKAF